MPAKIVYVEIPAPDLERTEAFYRSVFGWSVETSNLNDSPYAMFEAGDGALSGGFNPKLAAHDGGVILFLAVEDIASTLESVRAAGGSVLRDKEPIGGDYGFSAEFGDPNGNRLGLWSKT